MKLPEGKTRLDLVREGLTGGLKKTGRLVVSIDRLSEDPKNERRTFRNMEGLIASIKSVGLVEPITVIPTEGETYRIVTGHRRFRAAKEAGLFQVEVLIREPEDEIKRRQKSIISNVQREDVGPVELAEALKSILEEGPAMQSQEDLATLIGKDKRWVNGMLRILTLPPALQTQVRSTRLSLGYDAMIRVARVEDPNLQRELVEALLGGATQREIRDRIGENKPPTSSTSNDRTTATPKAKRVFKTEHQAIVIVQSTTAKLSPDRVVWALREALKSAYEQAGKQDE
ncbi:MAG: ParB/RepB/Spo0J family partition protein [Planctomycetia bacterium]|nr:ParB/RepB/Spo0J family partition protein [Planctomycetia bacterium]